MGKLIISANCNINVWIFILLGICLFFKKKIRTKMLSIHHGCGSHGWQNKENENRTCDEKNENE